MPGLKSSWLAAALGLWLAAAPGVSALTVPAAGVARALPAPADLPGITLPAAVSPAQVPYISLPDFEDKRTVILVAAAVVLFTAVLAILFIVIRRARPAQSERPGYEPKAYLNDLLGVTPSPSHELGSQPTMLGRVAGPENSHLEYIVIPETTIGRRHALIEYKDYAYWIIDQGSINGTYVNDKMVTSEARLKHGDRIKLHKYEFEFILPELLGTGMTVVSDTLVQQKIAGKPVRDKKPPRHGIQLSEDDFLDSAEDDATIQPGDKGFVVHVPASAAPPGDDEDDATITPEPVRGWDDHDETLQRYVDTSAYPTSDIDDDDADGNDRSRD